MDHPIFIVEYCALRFSATDMECASADLDEMIEIAHFTGGNFRPLFPALFLLPLMYAHSSVHILMCVKDGNNFHECKYAVRLIA